MTNLCRFALIGLLVGGTASVVLAQPEEPAAEAVEEAGPRPWTTDIAVMGVCLCAVLAAVGGGLGIARIGRSCMESIARQPEAGAQMFGPMVVGAAMVEGGMLFAILVCLLAMLIKI